MESSTEHSPSSAGTYHPDHSSRDSILVAQCASLALPFKAQEPGLVQIDVKYLPAIDWASAGWFIQLKKDRTA